MKKYLKVMLVLVVALSMICSFAFATEGEKAAADTNLETTKGTSDSDDPNFNPFKIDGNNDSASVANKAIKNVGATLIDLIKNVGYVVAVVMVLVTGIQWLIGTPAKKQELKGKLINVIIGAVLIVGATQLLGVIYSVANSSANNLTAAAPSISIKA